MPKAYLGLGSNLGDRLNNLKQALRLLESHEGIAVDKVSSIYETEPVGFKEQDWFLNMTVCITTSLSPWELLMAINQIERELKRERILRWGPRTIDIDILLFDDMILDTPGLKIPHPEMHKRAFVLVPLKEIAPEVVHPILNKRIAELLDELKTNEEVRIFKS
ncbi:Bifunctional folate synthesis protein [Koleobacter methoxysyntrophicus]|uniref:2-amino-4-hydroxy-6-hydroxymethyldihydropteridine diphosphokinase n=1 Tax=Koleobacter methoxysyntrophicus TaxID=2751313 RepID=A0A8A0RML2_9FIRM|nr:2-amino-4-hydroxy-6-hydroxymethyldihydropteridine diphosphokinase [Koleobacter methoxysyntrophicus]QSQ08838.1 Bifunctional folate synthesis protein [Koleobacter methoxysyntrophicus]